MCPGTRSAGDEALALELAIGLEHRVWVDGQVFDDLARSGEPIARAQDCIAHRVLHLLHELQIRGYA